MAYRADPSWIQNLMGQGGGSMTRGMRRQGQESELVLAAKRAELERAKAEDPLRIEQMRAAIENERLRREDLMSQQKRRNMTAPQQNPADGRWYQFELGPRGDVINTIPVPPPGASMAGPGAPPPPMPPQGAGMGQGGPVGPPGASQGLRPGSPQMRPGVPMPGGPPMGQGAPMPSGAPQVPPGGPMPSGPPQGPPPQGRPPGGAPAAFGGLPPPTPQEMDLLSYLDDPQAVEAFANGDRATRNRIGVAASRAKREAALNRATETKRQESGGVLLTPAQQKADEKFADDYIKFRTGGQADAQKGMQQLTKVYEQLTKIAEGGEGDLTGTLWHTLLPDRLIAQTKSGAAHIQAREAVEEVVQRNLRLILGAQFTQKEGERLIARAYNPDLEEKSNAERLKLLISQIDAAEKQTASAAAYYEQNGTLSGWKGRLYTNEDFLNLFPPNDDEEDEDPYSDVQAKLKAADDEVMAIIGR